MTHPIRKKAFQLLVVLIASLPITLLSIKQNPSICYNLALLSPPKVIDVDCFTGSRTLMSFTMMLRSFVIALIILDYHNFTLFNHLGLCLKLHVVPFSPPSTGSIACPCIVLEILLFFVDFCFFHQHLVLEWFSVYQHIWSQSWQLYVAFRFA